MNGDLENRNGADPIIPDTPPPSARLSGKALAATFGIGWGLVMLVVSAANLLAPPFGAAFLEAISSVYPGYEASGTLTSLVIATAIGIADGIFAGFLVAGLYNVCLRYLETSS